MTDSTNNYSTSHDVWQSPVTVPTDNGAPHDVPGNTVAQVELVRNNRSRRNRKARIARRELYNMTSQLAIMTQSGVDISSALISMAKQSKRPALKTILEAVNRDIIDGCKFSEALKRFPTVFNETYTTTVGAGESSGKLSTVLAQLAKLQRNEIRLRASIQKVLVYPIILTAVSSIVLIGLILFVLPQFADVFEQFETPLPFITQMLIDFSSTIRANILLCAVGMLMMIGGLLAFRWSAAGRRLIDHFVLTAPLVRNVTQALYFGRVCRLMGLMLESGVPLLETLGLAKRSIRNHLYCKLFEGIEDDVLNGGGIARGLLQSEFVPPSAAEMVITGEQTGSLGTVTQLVGEHYEEEGESKLRDAVTLLEPVITVVMGGLVAVVVMAVLLPMFDIATFANK